MLVIVGAFGTLVYPNTSELVAVPLGVVTLIGPITSAGVVAVIAVISVEE
jgi:hypothetical protein